MPKTDWRQEKYPAGDKVFVGSISVGNTFEVKRKGRELVMVGCLSRRTSCPEVIRRKFWHCPGCRRWPVCCGGCRGREQAMGGGSRQACWRVGWGCWWWQRWNPVPHSSASGSLSVRSDWSAWGHTNTLISVVRTPFLHPITPWLIPFYMELSPSVRIQSSASAADVQWRL